MSSRLNRGASALLLLGLIASRAAAQAPTTGGAFWPTLEVKGNAVPRLRFTLLGGLKQGEDYSYQQWRTGAGLELQSKRFARHRLTDIDPASEHKLDLGAGYQYLQTTEGPKPASENRIYLGLTPRGRPPGGLLLSDRNQFEFRWVNGVYSSRYRNRLTVERASRIGGLRLTPYASAEFFYDWAKDSWNEERYTVGVEWPYRDLLKLDTYYLYQDCTTCGPQFLNVAGLTLKYFLQN